jgi:hypothetical protein
MIMSEPTFWATPAQPPGHRAVELVHGPRDGAVIEVGPHITEWAGQDGRYAARDGHNPNRFFWDPAVGA